MTFDEDGKVLVWAGTSETLPDTDASQTVLVPRAVAPGPDAERRQLTVMFCDLVDSTRLSG